MRLIDADALKKDLTRFYDNEVTAKRLIDEQPTIEPMRKKGKWRRAYLDHEAMGERPTILYCSVCSQCIAYPVNFCPNCGADMRGEKRVND